jgi:aerobic carbon-monoxide dehydrogenase small subunit
MTEKVNVLLRINGRDHEISVEPRKTLVDAIRDDCGLTGTHIGCEHGFCGACTVIVGGETVRSCLMFAVQAVGSEVTTIEGLTPKDGSLSTVQEAFREAHGLQCGFCTPGFVVSLTAYLEEADDPSDQELREALSGNLCRCTGYQGIIRAARIAADAKKAGKSPRASANATA